MRAHIIEGTEVGALMEKIFGKIAVFFDHHAPPLCYECKNAGVFLHSRNLF